jgi:hypothetical protein
VVQSITLNLMTSRSQISVKFDVDVLDRLMAEAHRKRIPRAQIIREAVRSHLGVDPARQAIARALDAHLGEPRVNGERP